MENVPTAEGIMESLARLLAHQNGGTVADLVIVKKQDKEQEPA